MQMGTLHPNYTYTFNTTTKAMKLQPPNQSMCKIMQKFIAPISKKVIIIHEE